MPKNTTEGGLMQALSNPERRPVDPEVDEAEIRERALAWVNERRSLMGQQALADFPPTAQGALAQDGNPVAVALGCRVHRNVEPPLVWGLTKDAKVADALGLQQTYPGGVETYEGNLPGMLWRFAGV